MSIRSIAWTTILCGALHVSAVSAQTAPRSTGRGCDTTALARRIRFDTTGRAPSSYEGPVEGSSEGARIDVYFDAHRPRLLLVEYLGETGKLTYRFRLADSANYIVDRIESDYNAPIADSSFAGVARAGESRLFVCGGRPARPDQGELFKDASEVLESAMEYVSE